MLKVAFYSGETEHGPVALPLVPGTESVFEKTAAPALLSEVTRYITTLRPSPSSIYVLVNAMGAGEFYGSNINGDYFTEASLIHAPDNWTGSPVLDRVRAKTWPYGFPTFYDAHPFAHHRNKDPSRAYGEVELAAWNPKMRRVELVVRVDKDKCEQFAGTGVWDKLKLGQYPDVSMGCKVPYDTCSICLDWNKYRAAQATFDPKKQKSPGDAVLVFHKNLKLRTGHGIRGVSITRVDYCFPPGVPILLADGSYKPIEDIVLGDEVVTHENRTGPVVALLPSSTNAGLVSVKPWGMPELKATAEHAFLSARRPHTAKGRAAFLDDEVDRRWVEAKDLEPGDILFLPLPRVPTEQVVDHRLGWLLGIYLAEGSPNFSTGVLHPKSVGFTFHKSERFFAAELEETAHALDPNARVHIYDYPTRQAVCATVSSRIVAEWLLCHGGKGSHAKALNPAVWSYGKPFLRQVLRGWLDGDGSHDVKNDVTRGATSSTELGLQLQRVAGACGILATLHLYKRTTNFGYQEIWYVGFHGDAALAARQSRDQKHFAKQSKLFFWNGFLCSTVQRTQREEYDGPLYNFEVEGDNSYVAGACAVHNCDHAKNQMNRILPDGRKVFVYNDYPRFFDISFVFIGADKTAKVMLKIAEGRRVWSLPAAELAEKLGYDEVFDHLPPAEPAPFEKAASIPDELLKAAFGKAAKEKDSEIVKDVLPSQFAGKAVPILTVNEPDLPRDLVDVLGNAGLGTALSTTAGLGIVLRPSEFQRIVLISMGSRPVADMFDETGVTFGRSKGSDEVPLAPSLFSPALAQLLLPLLASRSGLAPAVERRIVVVSHHNQKEKKKSAASLSSPVLDKIGAAYNGYRSGLMELVADAQQLVARAAKPSDLHLHKLSEAPIEEVFTPLSVAYLKQAYMDELEGGDGTVKASQAEAGVERGLPSRNTRTLHNLISGEQKP